MKNDYPSINTFSSTTHFGFFCLYRLPSFAIYLEY